MSTLILDIYKNQKEIEKTLVADSYDLMFGTVEDVLAIFDPDAMTDEIAIATTVFKCFNQLKPLLKDIFPEATDEDLRKIKVKDLIPLFLAVCKNIADDIGMLKQGNSNRG